MIRKELMKHSRGESGFHWRGSGEISRIEGLSDAVFAFAVTLLVVSLEVPTTYLDLQQSMSGFVPFAICFGVLLSIWYQQYIFFRRYALQDLKSIVLNAVLLFVVLFYVYPLKFLFTLLIRQFSGTGIMVHGAHGLEPMIEPEQVRSLMFVYGGGYIAIFAVFAMMFLHAYSLRDGLELSEGERFDTRISVESALINLLVGVLSVVLAIRSPALAGWAYMLIGPLMAMHGSIRGGQRRKRFPQEERTE